MNVEKNIVLRGEKDMSLTWLRNGFICKDLYAPFVLGKDSEYLGDLKRKYRLVINQARNAGADAESLKILNKFKRKILEALKCYYQADIERCNTIIRNRIKDIGEDAFAVSLLNKSYAFPGVPDTEIQFFRSRTGNPSNAYVAKDMLHLPLKLRAKSGNYRFSIPGNPSLYLANSSYGCWIETGFPAENEFNVSPVLLDGTQKIFNLAVSIRDFHALNNFEENRVHCWLKLYMLAISAAYRVKETGRVFKSEYIISQSIMIACKRLGYDGIAYYSKRVYDEVFARCAINLALFVDYEGEYSELVNHIKIDDAFNYGLYKQLHKTIVCRSYELRSMQTGFITNIGSYDRQYPYTETRYADFDKFLFASWRDKSNGKGKDNIPWGVQIDEQKQSEHKVKKKR